MLWTDHPVIDLNVLATLRTRTFLFGRAPLSRRLQAEGFELLGPVAWQTS
jgi:hypothetical protein